MSDEIVIRIKPMLHAAMRSCEEGRDTLCWLFLLHWAADLKTLDGE